VDKLMAAHITGNIVLLAADVARGFGVSELIQLAAVPVFFLAVILLTVVHDDHVLPRHARHARVPQLLLIEAWLLVLAGAVAAVMAYQSNPLGPGAAAAIGLPAVLAMACQNAAHRLYPEIGPATTVMTGNITQFCIDQTRRARGLPEPSAAETFPAGERELPLLILAFGIGCVTAAFVTSAIGPSSFLLPGVLLLFVFRFPAFRPSPR